MPAYAQNLSLQLSPANYNGYNISCFGGRDGAIDLTITGGTPPYSILWSTRDTVEDLTGLASGYYRVEVADANPATTPVSAEITLTEPEAIRVNLTFSTYNVNSREYNISLNGACNGWINTSVTGGVEPYSYYWEQLNSNHQANANNLCAMEYFIQVTDANGCLQANVKQMTEPPRDDWTMNGNTGSDPNNNFIGTNDDQDLVIKTNAEERLRIKSDGNILINRFSGGTGMAYFDSLGRLQSSFNGFSAPCNNVPLAWEFNTPSLIYTCSPNRVAIGHYTIPSAARFYVNGQTHLNGNLGIGTAAASGNVRLTVDGPSHFDGDVGIGTLPQAGVTLMVNGKVGIGNVSNFPGNYGLYVADGILAEKVKVALHNSAAWADFVFEKDYKLMPLKELEIFITKNKHLPEIPSSEEAVSEGVDLAQMTARLLQKIEEQTLYIIELNRKIEKLENDRKPIQQDMKK
ncbi:MAG: hypothetical protein JNL47_07125 [Bacteroidia bacterium]|nr:hypothetical protein [Bacteroidia bacterium]